MNSFSPPVKKPRRLLPFSDQDEKLPWFEPQRLSPVTKNMGGIGDDSGVLFSRSRAVIWKDRHDPFGNMAFACLCGAPSLIVISKCSNAHGFWWHRHTPQRSFTKALLPVNSQTSICTVFSRRSRAPKIDEDSIGLGAQPHTGIARSGHTRVL